MFIPRLAIVLASLSVSVFAEPWLLHTIDDTAQGADGVRFSDANADGLPDIATAWEEAGEIRVYLHPGADLVQERWPRVTVGTVSAPEDAVLVDLDRDGASDVVSSCEGSERTIYFHWAPRDMDQYLNASAWETCALPASRDRMQWMYSLPMDVDDDGDLDLVAGGKGKGAALGWFECPANPRVLDDWIWHPMVSAGWIMSIEAFDVNADGSTDVVVSDRRGKGRGVYWLEHPASAGESWRPHRVGPVDNEEPMFLHVSTVTGETPSIAIHCAVKEKKIVRYRRVGDETDTWLRDAWVLPASYGTAKGVAALPGSNQVAFSCEHASDRGGVGLFTWGARDEKTVQEISGIPGTKFDHIYWQDMDKDGDADLVTTEENEGLGVIWYENPTSE